MAKTKKTNNFRKGLFIPENKEKYLGKKKQCIFRSSWEKKLMDYLDKKEHVIKWCSECVVVPYMLNGKSHRYYPDFFVILKKGDSIERVLIEVKPERETKKPRKSTKKSKSTVLYEHQTYYRNVAKWEAAQKYCKKRDWSFKILTEKDII